MATVAKTPIELVQPSGNEFLASLESKTGRNNFLRMMAHRPPVLKTVLPFYGAIMGPGPVEERIKELIYLTVSYANRCAFCTAAHVASSKKAGVTDEERRALQTEQDHVFNESERAAIQYARELTRTANADQTRAALRDHFSDEQVVEITLVAAIANFTNRFNNGLEVKPEA